MRTCFAPASLSGGHVVTYGYAVNDATRMRTTVKTHRPRGTSYDVARAAGVSQSAVSRCFRPGASVAPATRARIVAAAAALGYRPNAIAQGLITRRSNMVAVIISNLTNLFYPEVLAQLTQRLSDRGARVLLFTLPAESDVDAVLDQVWRYRVDGAIVAARLSPAQIASFAAETTALVLYNRDGGMVPVASVSCDYTAGDALIAGLIAAGHRSFALIEGPADSAVSAARMASARHALAAAGLAPVAAARGDFGYTSGYAAADRLLAGHPIDAIIAANDVMAIGAIDAARLKHAIDIPAKLAVVGFDGIAPAAWRSYELTTVRQPVDAMAAAAVAMLFDQIETPGIDVARQIFAGAVVPGATARLA